MLTMACAGNVWADEAAQGGHWINVEEGPGVAQWVDDNGVVTEQPGDEPDQGQDSQDPGETSQSGEDGQAAAEAGENQEGQVSQEGLLGGGITPGFIFKGLKPEPVSRVIWH